MIHHHFFPVYIWDCQYRSCDQNNTENTYCYLTKFVFPQCNISYFWSRGRLKKVSYLHLQTLWRFIYWLLQFLSMCTRDGWTSYSWSSSHICKWSYRSQIEPTKHHTINWIEVQMLFIFFLSLLHSHFSLTPALIAAHQQLQQGEACQPHIQCQACAEALQAVRLPACFRNELALRTTWLAHDKQVKEPRQESPDTLALLACMHFNQLILEVFLQQAPCWQRNAVGTVSGSWHSSCSAGRSPWRGRKGFTGKQLSREINTPVTHCPRQFWHIHCFCFPVLRRVGIPFPQIPLSTSTVRTTTEVDTDKGASPLAKTFSIGSKL